MAELHKIEFPFTAKFTTESIKVVSLDDYFRDMKFSGNILLKIDVQGLEYKVLLGAKNFLEKVSVLIIESSFANLYEGQHSFEDLFFLLSGAGFRYSGSISSLPSKTTPGLNLQEDSVFLRKDTVSTHLSQVLT